MSDTKKKNKSDYRIQYAKDNYKRIPLDVRIEDYEKIKKASQKANESINGYIKKAVSDRIDKEK